jgi:hypothetical protein
MNLRPNPFVSAFIAFATIASLAFAQIPIAPATAPDDTQDAKPVPKPDPNQKSPQDAKPKPLVPTTIPSRDPVPTNVRPAPPPPAVIEKPADPAKVRANFEIGGQRVDVTEGELYDCYKRLEKLEPKNAGRILNAERVYEQILAYAEAKALGLEATPEEVANFDPLARNPTLLADARKGWEAQGITQEMYDTYQREVRTIQKAKDLFVNSLRVLSAEVFDAFRRDHFTYRLDYVEFPAAQYSDALKQKPPTDAELEAFWKEDKAVQNKLRGQANVSAELVSFDPSKPSPNGEKPVSVPRAEALVYYNKNRVRLDGMIPSEERSKLYPTAAANGDPIDVKTLKTPFQILSDLGIIEREIQQSARMRTAFEAAKKPGADLRAIAAEHGLVYEKIERVDRDQMIQKYSRYGPQIFGVLFNQNAGDMSPDVRAEPQIQYFYRVTGKEGANLPDFAAVKDKPELLQTYIETTSTSRAQKAAQAMRQAIDKNVDAEIRAEEEKTLKEADAAADAEIKTKNITDPKEIELTKSKYRGPAMTRIRAKKDTLAPKHFEAYVKENGLKLVDTGPFDLMSPRRDNKTGEEQMRMKFLVSNPMLRSMDVGTISSVLTDQGSRCHFIVRVSEKSEPDYQKMTDGELLQMRAQLERARSYQPVQRWQYADISRRRDLKIN